MNSNMLGWIIGLCVVVLFLAGFAIFIHTMETKANKDRDYEASMVNREARIEKSGTTVFVVKRISLTPRVYLCRFDNGPGAVPRFQMIECTQDELTYTYEPEKK